MKKYSVIFLLIFLPLAITAQQQPKVLYQAFSHNDYTRTHPLTDALSLGFNCVEADLWLIDGELYVSHNRPNPKPEITFENLYLKPIVERTRANNRKVYSDSNKPFFLMLDFKKNGEDIYALLKQKIEPYKDLFCRLENGVYHEGSILLFISGDRPLKTLPLEPTRIAMLDGKIADLNDGIPATMMPVISDNYSDYFKWNGIGEMPNDELAQLRKIVKETHKEGKLFRFWGAPDTQSFMRFQLREHIDLIGADNLQLLYNILTKSN